MARDRFGKHLDIVDGRSGALRDSGDRRCLREITVVLSQIPALASAQSPLEHAKSLYESAEFEGALTELSRISHTDRDAVEAMEYRILCLLALDRPADAELVAEALVLTAPNRAVRADDFPPRYVSLMTTTRERLLPAARDAQVLDFAVTHEPRATFRAAPGARRLRPGTRTATQGLFLAGAWTDTGWPATMEGAVRSGLAAARSLTTMRTVRA